MAELNEAEILVVDQTSTNPGRQSDDDMEYGDAQLSYGKLLTLKDRKLAEYHARLWAAKDERFEKRLAQWRVNMFRRAGFANVKLRREGSGWRCFVPPGASPDRIPSNNKLAELVRKLIAVLLSDPPAADPVPFSGSDEDVYAAQVSARVLEDIDDESTLSETMKVRYALYRSADYGSGFEFFYVDPEGGGRVPIEIEAHPSATSVYDALEDPMTGEPKPPPYFKRFVTPDGRLTESRAEAAERDLPVLRSRVLSGRNVRFIPDACTDLWDAEGIMIGEFVPWGTVKSLHPELEDLESNRDNPELKKILSYRPAYADSIAGPGQDLDDQSENLDEKMVFQLTTFMRKSPGYPYGAEIVTLGDCYTVHQGEWCIETDEGLKEAMDLPMTQYTLFTEGREDPYGVGVSEILGPGNELRLAMIGAILDHLDRLNNRKIFVPWAFQGSDDALQNPDKKVMRVAPGETPGYEDVPTVPPDTWKMEEKVSRGMDSESGLEQTAQGMENPSVKSGRHALAVVQQAMITLSEPRQGVERGFTRSGRIKLQMVRKFYETPREVGWTSADDEHKLEAWSNADLRSTRDVKLKPGTLTLLTPAAKAQMAEHYFTLGIIDPLQMKDWITSNVGGTLGLEDDPHLMRIRRQISEWTQGPPEGWMPPQPPMMIGPNFQLVPAIDPNTGQPIPPPPDPYLESIWEAVPADNIPEVAQVRFREVAKLMASQKYGKKPPEWRYRVVQEFQIMSQAMMPPQAPQPGQQSQQEQVSIDAGSPQTQTVSNDAVGLSDLEQMAFQS